MGKLREMLRIKSGFLAGVFKSTELQSEDNRTEIDIHRNMQESEYNKAYTSSTAGNVQPSYKQMQNHSLTKEARCLPISKTPVNDFRQKICAVPIGCDSKDRLKIIEERRAKQAATAKSHRKVARAKRIAMRREMRFMKFTENRIAEHRAERALRVSSGVREERAKLDRILKELYRSPDSSQKLAHDISFYENQTLEESRQYVQQRLTEVLGPERMQAPLLPSGHNPVDPVIDEYNRQVATNNILEQWEAQKAEMRRQEEEQQRLAAEQEAARLKTQVLFEHYRAVYINRLESLATYGPKLSLGINMLEAALQAGNMHEACIAVRELTWQILLPIHGLLEDCHQEIPLEEVGAEKLKDAWPLQRLEAMYQCLRGEPNLPSECIDMLQGIEAISKAIANPTPFQDPFAPKPVQINPFFASILSNTNGPINNVLPAGGFSIPSAAPVPASSNFSNLVIATAENTSEQQREASSSASSGFSKLLAATADKAKNEQKLTAASDVAPPVPAASNSPARSALLQYIATDNMYFDTEVADLIRNSVVVGMHRRQAIDCLKELLDKASGEEGILGAMDGGNYRTQIETCVRSIDALPSRERLNRDTQALRKLCGQALKLWAVYAK